MLRGIPAQQYLKTAQRLFGCRILRLEVEQHFSVGDGCFKVLLIYKPLHQSVIELHVEKLDVIFSGFFCTVHGGIGVFQQFLGVFGIFR
jgi:hypothetical protein